MDSYLKTSTILYVEDDHEVRLGYSKALSRIAKTLYTANDGEEGLKLYNEYAPDIVITDLKMPHKCGIEMTKEIRKINPEQVVLFTTAHTDSQYTIQALDLQVDAYLLKPVDKKKLETKINQLSRTIFLEKQNHEQQLMLQQILNNQSNITILTDLKTIKFASRSFWHMLYIKNKEVFFEIYPTFLDIFITHEHYIYGNTPGEFLRKYFDSEDDMRLVSIISENGPTAFFISLDKIKDTQEELFVITLTDVSSLQASRLDALHKASHDKLTKVHNRSAFEKALERELLRTKRYERPLCMALLDIDRFKQVNDSFGHLIGDEILILLARKIRDSLRGTDTFARWGGEEFVILFGETNIQSAQKVCETVRKNIEELMHPIAGNITLSIGTTAVTLDDSPTTLFKRCDKALYLAKSNGRNRVEIL